MSIIVVTAKEDVKFDHALHDEIFKRMQAREDLFSNTTPKCFIPFHAVLMVYEE